MPRKVRAAPARTRRPKRSPGGQVKGALRLPPVELYTPERKAEFLLGTAVDAKEYARAVKQVRKMGLDPEKIDHFKPRGV